MTKQSNMRIWRELSKLRKSLPNKQWRDNKIINMLQLLNFRFLNGNRKREMLIEKLIRIMILILNKYWILSHNGTRGEKF
jgi:hypothetical protein